MQMMRPKRGRRVVLDFGCVDELRDFCGSNNISGATVRDGLRQEDPLLTGIRNVTCTEGHQAPWYPSRRCHRCLKLDLM